MNRQKAIDLGFKHYTELNGDEYFSVWRLYYNGEILNHWIPIECIKELDDFQTRQKARDAKDEIDHDSWLSDMQRSQKGVITAEQIKKLREGDTVWFTDIYGTQTEPFEYHITKDTLLDYIQSTYNCYFARSSARDALVKKVHSDLKELAKIGQEIQPEYFSAEYATVNLKKADQTAQKQKISRVEFISEKGRDFIAWNHDVEEGKHFELSYQDGGRTLKIFERKLS